MSTNLLSTACLVLLFSACATTSRNSNVDRSPVYSDPSIDVPHDLALDSLTNLPRTEDGGFVLSPGYYEAEFKAYCLQPGTPDPRPSDAYLQAPISGYRKDIVQSVLSNSRTNPNIKQKNVQLLLWSIVSGSDFNKLSTEVQLDAHQLLTSKQIFELKGGVLGVIKNVSNSMPGGSNAANAVKKMFDMGTSSYEAYERIAVLREPAKVRLQNFNNNQWYKQAEGYYVRYFPVSYKSMRIQVYVPSDALDASGKVDGEYLVFDPVAMQAIPANSNAQKLGVGGVIVDVVREVIKVNKRNKPQPRRIPEKKPHPKTGKVG